MNRKHLISISVLTAILLLFYWLVIAEDMNAWLSTCLIFPYFLCAIMQIKCIFAKNVDV